MILAVHQPIFLPWPGFFHKALHCDRLVLLDDVQFPRGRTWLTRNRLKDETGEVWLHVPVRRKGRGLQMVRNVEIAEERGWRRKHLRLIRQDYANAPYLEDHLPGLEAVYRRSQRTLVAFNLDLIRLLWSAFSPGSELVLQSDLGAQGKGTGLMVDLCRRCRADRLALLPGVEKHLQDDELARHGVRILRLSYRPIVYPQLWGGFVYNLSALDLLLNCGPRSRRIVEAGGG